MIVILSSTISPTLSLSKQSIVKFQLYRAYLVKAILHLRLQVLM